MSCNAYGSRTRAAIIALAASGYLAVSGATANPAAGESGGKAHEGWLTQVRRGEARVILTVPLSGYPL